MGNPGGEGDDAARISRLVGDLLVGLGEKVRAAGVDGVRILTEEELQSHQLSWFRAGWEEHARASDPDRPHPAPGQHPDSEDFPPPPVRVLRFPDRQPTAGSPPRGDERAPGHGQSEGNRGPYPLPIVGAGDARIRNLMPHRPRPGSRRSRGDDDDPAEPEDSSD